LELSICEDNSHCEKKELAPIWPEKGVIKGNFLRNLDSIQYPWNMVCTICAYK